MYTRFEDENDGNERPASQGSTRRTKASALEDMITKDDRGWLDMASNEIGKDNRPQSTDSIKDKPSRPGKLFLIFNKQLSPEAGCLLYYITFKTTSLGYSVFNMPPGAMCTICPIKGGCYEVEQRLWSCGIITKSHVGMKKYCLLIYSI